MNLIVLNPHARGGRTMRIWPRLEPILLEHFNDLIIAVTRRVDEVAQHIDKARAVGVERIIVVGGDGTNHVLVNALLSSSAPGEPPIAIGQIPIGTGRDWARTLNIPLDPVKAVHWLAEAEPHPCDVGRVTLNGQTRLFLNIASTGVAANIDRRVNRVANRKPWTFLRAILTSLIQYRPQHICVTLDGIPFYTGSSYVAAVANGRWFGHGILAAPDAAYDDGLFDVVVLEGMSRVQVIQRLAQAYKGQHIGKPKVHHAQARRVEITAAPGETLGLDLDGEPDQAQHMTFELLPAALYVLAKPISPAQIT
ncbi:MAG: diacylglycerol kinase family lipid kinase [Anaerolineae bacterium]|nr:diacylglycerol kinase family lipid kinase [Anaerolineae bacterium]